MKILDKIFIVVVAFLVIAGVNDNGDGLDFFMGLMFMLFGIDIFKNIK